LKTKGNFATLHVKKGDTTFKYEAEQFHIHTPSEHKIMVDGVEKLYDAELHIVFKVIDSQASEVGDLTYSVVGILFDSASDTENAFLKEWDLDNVDREEFNFNLDLLKNEFKKDGLDEFYFYDGGLTTPTCDEVVNWHVIKKPLAMSKAQLTTL